MTSLQRAAAEGASSKKRWTKHDKLVRGIEKEKEKSKVPTKAENGLDSRKKENKKYPETPFEHLLSTATKAVKTGSVLIDEDRLKPDSFMRVVTACCLPAEPIPSTIHVKPLIVLDLNGILCHRIRQSRDDIYPHLMNRPSPICIASTPIVPRLHLIHFLTFLDAHFTLAVWTSAKLKTAKKLISFLIPNEISKKLLFVWAQHNCNIVAGNMEPIFIKNLDLVWRTFPLWNASNTLLMDDSPDKCPIAGSAIHPPALHGKVHGDNTVMSDAENEGHQMEFFQELAGFFAIPRETFTFYNNAGEAKSSDDLQIFLQCAAGGHMGWRGSHVKQPFDAHLLTALRPSQVV
jgi:NLI interacting factor-like phosphatase